MRNTFLTLAGCLMACALAAQNDGSLDPTFNPDDVGYGTGYGIDGWSVRAMALPNGGMLVGGYIASYNCTPTSLLIRLHQNGTLDESFSPDLSFLSGAFDMRSDTIVVGGGNAQYRLRQVLSDGTLVPTSAFPIGGDGPNGSVEQVKFLPDGRVAIAGSFTLYNGVARNRIAVANADGSLNTQFAPGNGPTGAIHAMAIDNAGRILIGGDLSNYDGTPCSKIIRLNNNGGIDPGFNAGAINGTVSAIAIDASGRIIIGGGFTLVNDTVRNRIARLLPDGSVDTSFDPGSGAEGSLSGEGPSVSAVTLYPDGRIALAGVFSTYDGSSALGLARIFDNGAIDPTFSASGGPLLEQLAVDPDGNLILAGYGLDRLLPTGSRDPSFNPRSGVRGSVDNIVVRSDGKAVISGGFAFYNNQSTSQRIARILADGEAIDPSFDAGAGFSGGEVFRLLLDQDEKIIAAGRFTAFNNTTARSLIRLLPDGAIDPGFLPGTGTTGFGWLDAIAIQPTDGKILAGGVFSSFNNEPRNGLVRLNYDGSLDTTFNSGGAQSGGGSMYPTINAIALANGKILVGGNFTAFDGVPCGRIARLHTDGTVDTTFNPLGAGANLGVRVIHVLPSGKILIGGSFASYNGIPCRGIARLHADGSFDDTFDPGSESLDIYGNNNVRGIIVQPDGSLLINGYFQTVDGMARHGLARLSANGELDQSFDPGEQTGCNTDYVGVPAMAQQGTGKLIVGGNFVSFAGTGRNGIARLYNDIGTGVEEHSRDPFRLFPNPTNGQFTLALEGISGSVEVALFNMTGQQVATTHQFDAGTPITMDASRLANGTYIVYWKAGERTGRTLLTVQH